MNSFLKNIIISSSLLLSQSLFSQVINIDIDWNNSLDTIPKNAYGINSPANFIPSYSNDDLYMSQLELITQKKGFIRLHGWGMLGDSPEAWQENGIWDSAKINQALTPLIEGGYEVIINIPSGPQGEDDYQDPEVFAQFCADLVQIVNIDLELGVQYWEIPNEREQGFSEPGLSVEDMSTLISTSFVAMKNIDPSIKVGGAATAWVNIDYLSQLTQATYPNIDFITCHTYSGDCNNSLQDAYNIAQYAVEDLAVLRQNIDLITGENHLPIILTEYNLSYQGCDNIQSNYGAVYDAIIMTQSIKSGADATCYWAVAPYSDMSIIIGETLDDNAYLYQTMNKYFYGELIQSSTSNNEKVLVYTTIDQDLNKYSTCLINRTAIEQNIQLEMSGITPDTLNRYTWDIDNGYHTEISNWSELNNGNFDISPFSVNIFVGDLSTLSISEAIPMDLRYIFPNPSNGIITLSGKNTPYSYQVFSNIGAIIKSGELMNGIMDLTDITKGRYTIILKNKEAKTRAYNVILN